MNQIEHAQHTSGHRLYRSRRQRRFAGVAGGLAEYFGIDPTPMRVVLFLALLASSGPGGIVIYAALAVAIPGAPDGS